MATAASPKASGWVLGAVVLSLGLGAGSWFLGISPILDDASEARSQAETTRASNDILQIKIDRLADQFANLDEYKAELATLRQEIPTDAAIPEYLREIDSAAEARSVVVMGHTAELGREFVLPVVAAPAAPAEGEDAEGAEDGATEPEAPVVPAGFVEIPFGVWVVGTFDDVRGFVNDLQTGTDRLFLVNGMTSTSQPEAEGSSGRPGTRAGDVEMIVTGMLYVLPDMLTAPPVEGEEAPSDEIPSAPAGRNPFAPLPGTTETD